MADDQKMIPEDATSDVNPPVEEKAEPVELEQPVHEANASNDADQTAAGQGIFTDLLRDAPISSLQIEEPEFSDFDMTAVLEEARTITKKPKRSRSKLGKRIRQTFAQFQPKDDQPKKDESSEAEPVLNIEEDPNQKELTSEIVQAVQKAAAMSEEEHELETPEISATLTEISAPVSEPMETEEPEAVDVDEAPAEETVSEEILTDPMLTSETEPEEVHVVHISSMPEEEDELADDVNTHDEIPFEEEDDVIIAAPVAHDTSFLPESPSMEDLIQAIKENDEEPALLVEEEAETSSEPREISLEELINTPGLFDEEVVPKTFAQLLQSGFGAPAVPDLHEELMQDSQPIAVNKTSDTLSDIGRLSATRAMPSLTEQMEQLAREKKEEEARAKAALEAEIAAKAALAEEEEEEDQAVYDPKASLVDVYRYDEYLDKQRFLLSDYKKTEEYLNKQSRQGYHYVHHEGKKYYFIKGKPHDFYYKILYFAKEPSDEYWDKLEDDGWKEIDTQPSRNKRDAGWYVVRNEKKEGDLSKVIENEEEKYRYFSKFSSSCRSTMFLLFVVMVCSALTMWLQYEFKGFKAVIIASTVLFVIALWVFLVYARLLNKSRKQASLLSARMRLADNDPEYQAMLHAHDTDQDLEDAWDAIGRDDEDDD